MIAAMVARFQVDFTWLLQAVIHERAFVFCSYAGLPVWNIDVLKTLTVMVDIGLINDKAN